MCTTSNSRVTSWTRLVAGLLTLKYAVCYGTLRRLCRTQVCVALQVRERQCTAAELAPDSIQRWLQTCKYVAAVKSTAMTCCTVMAQPCTCIALAELTAAVQKAVIMLTCSRPTLAAQSTQYDTCSPFFVLCRRCIYEPPLAVWWLKQPRLLLLILTA